MMVTNYGNTRPNGITSTKHDPVLGSVTPLDIQVGGSHYKTKSIQPVEYCMANGIGFMEGSVIKYVTRWRDKGGLQDLEKAKHFLEMLIEYEKKSPPRDISVS